MPGRHLPADHSRGDANTIGGYMAVHARPAAFEGPDGMSYSVEISTDSTGDPERPIGAFFLFLRWRRIGEPGVEGHIESEFVAHGRTEDEARERIGAMTLNEVRDLLHRLVGERSDTSPTRRWWDVMRDEGLEGDEGSR